MICRFSRTVLAVACLLMAPAATLAQSVQPAQASTRAQPTAVRKDSIWNGALIGAGVGAVAGAFIGSVTLPCSECAGFNVPLTFGVIGAGAGAVIGAGIDARLHRRSPTASPAVRAGRINISPVIGSRVKGLIGSIRF